MDNNRTQSNHLSEAGIPSGFDALDRFTGGWHAGDLIVIGSRPYGGKSSFALQTASRMALSGTPVLLFSVEMAAGNAARRLLLQQGAPADGKIDPDIWEPLEGRLQKLAKAPLYIDDTPCILIGDLVKTIERAVHENGIKVAIIDYVQLVRGPQLETRPSRQEEVGFVVRELKRCAREQDIAIIALSQMSRFLKGEPRLSDLRESTDLAEVSDTVVFVSKEGFTVAKNHSGTVGAVTGVQFSEESLTFNA